MQSRGRPASPALGPRISLTLLAMFATMASVYVAGRLWLDSQSRVLLIHELRRRTGQGLGAVSVDDTLRVVACRDQHKRLSALEMELASAREGGFVGRYEPGSEAGARRKVTAVIGVATAFGRKGNRDLVRKSWLSNDVKKLEEDKGVIVRFVIGRSANRGDSMDRDIDDENKHMKDFMILDNHIEAPEEISKKTKQFLIHAADTWDAEFYIKVNDDIHVNIDALGAMLATYLDKPRLYIGCMKSGEVFSEANHKWYEPDWWKFGDGKTYFRHASGEMFVVSRAVAQFISINRYILRTYAHDDISVGSWLIGLDVKHVDEAKLCCTSWSTGAVCAAM